MSVYEVTDPKTGVTLELEGDSPPTEAELEEIFASVSAGTPPAPPEPFDSGRGFTRGVAEELGHFLRGLVPSAEQIGQVPGAMKDVVRGQLEQGDPSVFLAPGVVPAMSAMAGGIKEASAQAMGVAEEKGRPGLVRLLYGTPVAGPMIARAAEPIAEGRVQEGLGRATGMTLPFIPGTGLTGASRTRLAAPLKKELSRDVLTAAERQGADLPASALTEAPLPAMAETIGIKGIWGGRLRTHARQAFQRMDDIAEEIRASVRTMDPVQAGPLVADKIGRYRAEFQRLKDEAYSAAQIPARGHKIVPERTLAVLDDTISRKTAARATDIASWKRLRAQIARGKKGAVAPIELSDFREVIKDWNARFGFKSGDPVLTGNTAAVARLKATASEEFEALLGSRLPEVHQEFAKAQQLYSKGLAGMKSAIGPIWARFEQKPDLLVSHLLNPKTSLADLPRLQEILGAEGMEAVQGVVLGDILAKARSVQTGQLMTGSIAAQMKKWGERLPNLLTPAQYEKLRDLGVLARSMKKAEKYVKGSQTMPLSALSARLGLGVLVWGYNPAMVFALIGGEAVLTRMLSSPYMRKWLTSGLGPELATLGRTATAGAAAGAAGSGLRPARPPESMDAPPLARLQELLTSGKR